MTSVRKLSQPPLSAAVDVDKIEGLPAWDLAATYSTGNNVKESGKIWESLQDNNIGHIPSADNALAPVWWKELSATHIHQNKSLLDSITATLISAWNTAFSKAHDQNTDSGTDKDKFNLGAAITAGTERLLEAIGSLANIGITFKFKGTGKAKFVGASYVITREKVLVLNIAGEIIGQYDVEDEFVAPPPTLTSPGTPGQKAWDNTFLYYCVAPSVWIKLLPQSGDLTIENFYIAVPPTDTFTGLQGQRAYGDGKIHEAIGINNWVNYRAVKDAVRPVTAAYTALTTDRVIVLDATAASFTLGLPPALNNEGLDYILKRTDATANTITVDPSGTELINGTATIQLAANSITRIISDNSNWITI